MTTQLIEHMENLKDGDLVDIHTLDETFYSHVFCGIVIHNGKVCALPSKSNKITYARYCDIKEIQKLK